MARRPAGLGDPGLADRILDCAGAATAAPAASVAHFDLRAGSPDLSTFPVAGWLAALRRALAATPAGALGYGDPRGRPELRRALAGYLARARGVHADPERIVVCSGFAQGLALLCAALQARDASTVAVESHGLPASREILRAHGLRPSPVPVDDGGADVQVLDDHDAVLLTPAHQFPLGPSLAAARRAALTEWAAESGGLVIEDDYDGEFRYDRHPLGALQALAPDHVAYLGTASKTLAPGLRLGWLVLPAALAEPVLAAKAIADFTSALEQLALARFIESGHYDRHVRGRRLAYRRRRDTLLRTLAQEVPAASVTGIAAGLHELVTLPPGSTEPDVIAAAARRDLAVAGLATYAAADHDRPPALVVGYATPPEHAFTAAVARLTATLAGG
jgi:GntR family transcriptional regulator/MocR family aminotransferase